jgi:hypothetical protein
MKLKTIAFALSFLFVPSFAATAEAREPDAREKRVAAAPAPAAAVTSPRSAESRAPETAPESGENARKVDQTEGERDGARDEGPSPDGFSIGARIGYALPLGSVAMDSNVGATDLSRWYSGMVPFWGDIGYRINPRWYVGGYFQVGIAGTSGDVCNRSSNGGNCSSSGTDIRFGAFARYSFTPAKKMSPWLGVSSGYEITNLSINAGTNTQDTSLKGWEFVGLHLGLDFRPIPEVSLGPMVTASFGQYQSYSLTSQKDSSSSDFRNTALHEWVFFGFRGQYDL